MPAMTAPPTSTEALSLRGRRVHFIGIGGAGMCGLARLVQQQGAICTGSDLRESENLAALRAAGMTIHLEQTDTSLPEETDLVVISAAIRDDHPELAQAKRRGLTVMKYAAMLGQLMHGQAGVAVAGTHGKSTTTAMLCHILIAAGLDPSFILGAQCQQIGGGSRCGGLGSGQTKTTGDNGHGSCNGEGILVAEACEYDRSFHNLRPTHGLILNVEADHLDLYASLDEIVEAFRVFAESLPAASEGGSLLISHAMAERLTVTAGLNCAVQTLGFSPEADWQVQIRQRQRRTDRRERDSDDAGDDATKDAAPQAPTTTCLYHGGELMAHWPSPLPGEHMAYNAAAAAVTAHRLGASWSSIAEALGRFEGLDRRMQLLGTRVNGQAKKPGADGVRVIDDYGHHPTEVDATLRALRGHWQPQRLICVFQPHQHSRTRFLMQQFATSFSQADLVLVPDIYFVRDSQQERQAVTAGDLVDALRAHDVQALHIHPLEAIVEQLAIVAEPGDLVVTMGAGDVWQVGHRFVQGAD
jgi:UDP-N-acetylmuramate--alanine ligase